MNEPIRQGDVYLIPAAIPANATPVPRDGGRVVLAYGEVTGHSHAIADRAAEQFEADNARFLRIVGVLDVDLAHEEHSTIAVSPGEWLVIAPREWTRDLGERRVVD